MVSADAEKADIWGAGRMVDKAKIGHVSTLHERGACEHYKRKYYLIASD